MPGIDDVARRAGVSTATVSRTLSGRGPVSADARARVEAAASELGYVVSSAASSLASGRTQNIGVLVPFVDHWFFSVVLSGIASALMARGYDLALYGLSRDDAERAVIFDTFLRRQRVDGVIAVALELDPAEIEQLSELRMPVVAVGGELSGIPSLTVDDFAMARDATEHLIGLGHQRIAHIAGGTGTHHDFELSARRRAGYEQAMADAGFVPGPIVESTFTIAGGHAAARELLADGCTAVFAAADEAAIGAILAAREAGLAVPADLSVVGIDGHELGAFFGLTTIDQAPAEQGRRAAELMLAVLDGDAVGPHTALPFSLVTRSSTAPL